jgi:hypothetical protein
MVLHGNAGRERPKMFMNIGDINVDLPEISLLTTAE